MSIKVLFVGDYDIAVHNIRPEAEALIGLKQLGVDVEVMTQGACWYADRMRSFGIRIHDFTPARKFSLAAIRRIRAVLREGAHDVIHLFNNKAIVSGIFASLGQATKVVTYRGQTGNIYWYDPTCYLTHLSPRVDRIVCVANAVRDDLRKQMLNKSKPVTIYKGPDLDWYERTVPASLGELGIPEGAFVLGCVANNRPRKGVPVLIEATRYLPADLPIHILLVGGGMDSPGIARLIAASPMADRIHRLGYRDDIPALISACSASVLPATKREGLPKTVIESMVYAIAPIVTATGGSPELVVDGECGLVVPPSDAKALADAIVEMARDKVRRDEWGARARERIRTHFNIHDAIAQHKRLYEELTGKTA
jgi:glycosyltransferase involved in cell wall biosynthesis